jgi:hypothetical protein
MYEEDYLEDGVNELQPRTDRPFETQEDVAKHLSEIEDYNNKAINKDSGRANNSPDELKAVRANAKLINKLLLGQKMFGWNFEENGLIDYFTSNRAITEVTSRSKHGWMPTLLKSNYNIQQYEDYSRQIESDFSDDVQQSVRDKISNKVPLLKRQEL